MTRGLPLNALVDEELCAAFGVQVLIVNDVHEVDYDILQRHLIHPIDRLVLLRTRTDRRVRAHLLLYVVHCAYRQSLLVLVHFRDLLLRVLFLLNVRRVNLVEQERNAKRDDVLELRCNLHLDLIAHLLLVVHRL